MVDGIPEEYLQMNGTYQMTPEQRVEWAAEVRSLYDGMVRIVITPTWVKLIDFHTTLPSAVQELVEQREGRRFVVTAGHLAGAEWPDRAGPESRAGRPNGSRRQGSPLPTVGTSAFSIARLRPARPI